ncbi:NAD(P)H-dependent oxidoreductase [Mycetocola sp. 2940]|uniref:NADPH-dependent FMN reductase n=1 Tax=Mycetocola sp. 2940 TaxID=3156452 RepID=UPI0033921420
MFDSAPVQSPVAPMKLMIILGSVRPQRVGLSVALWVHELVTEATDIEIDFVDLAELNLPFMDEPGHPRDQQYTKRHTWLWSARVQAADAFLFVTPECNRSFSPALKNAIDFLYHEWVGKPVGFVSYGGLGGGTRGVDALRPVLGSLRLVLTKTNIAIRYVTEQMHDGSFVPSDTQRVDLITQLAELRSLKPAVHDDHASSRVYAIT